MLSEKNESQKKNWSKGESEEKKDALNIDMHQEQRKLCILTRYSQRSEKKKKENKKVVTLMKVCKHA